MFSYISSGERADAMIITEFLPDTIRYSGEELSEGWLSAQTGIAGEPGEDVVAAFLGPCDVRPEFMIDTDDIRDNARIFSEMMLHFIAEHRGMSLEAAVLRQRLLASAVAENINSRAHKLVIKRRGDDLFDGERKLSISIATLSPNSALIHFAVNIESSDYPLPVKGVADYNIEPRGFAAEILSAYSAEWESIEHARKKVRPAGIWKGNKSR